MSGVAIVRALLAAHAPLLALMPATSIRSGTYPQGKPLPAISVRSISSNEQWTTARNLETKMVRERVQVTAYAKDFTVIERVLKAASLGRGVHTGTVVTFQVRSVLPEGVGPYIEAIDDGIHEQSRDFMVTFIEAN